MRNVGSLFIFAWLVDANISLLSSHIMDKDQIKNNNNHLVNGSAKVYNHIYIIYTYFVYLISNY